MEGKPVAPGKTDIAIDEMAMVSSLLVLSNSYTEIYRIELLYLS